MRFTGDQSHIRPLRTAWLGYGILPSCCLVDLVIMHLTDLSSLIGLILLQRWFILQISLSLAFYHVQNVLLNSIPAIYGSQFTYSPTRQNSTLRWNEFISSLSVFLIFPELFPVIVHVSVHAGAIKTSALVAITARRSMSTAMLLLSFR